MVRPHSCNGCKSMEKRLLQNIQSENQNKKMQKGGKIFLKYEIKSSDVRLQCRQAKQLIDKTKKYVKGTHYK